MTANFSEAGKCDTAAIIVAAGTGSRFGGEMPKQYRPLGGRPLIAHTIDRFASHSDISRTVVAIHPDHRDLFAAAVPAGLVEATVSGGASRQESVRAALDYLTENPPENVLIHDGARPLPSQALIGRVIAKLETADGVVPALSVTDTLVRADNGLSGEAVPRDGLQRVQTPQGFRFGLIEKAHRDFAGQSFTDDAGLAKAAGGAVHLVEGDEMNIKLTHPEDEARLQMYLGGTMEPRMGSGFDVHRLGPASPDISAIRLGGIDIPFNRALLGHSDADVALHAITDALLGALAAGDIGTHFPPSDEAWRGKDSAHFLIEAARMAKDRGAVITLVDLTIICQTPKIGSHRPTMVGRLADILGIEQSRVSIKATTTEGLGFTGRTEGIASMASVTLMLPTL